MSCLVFSHGRGNCKNLEDASIYSPEHPLSQFAFYGEQIWFVFSLFA